MRKRLIIMLALAFVVGISFAAYAEVQNVKVSGDLTVLAISRQLALTSQKSENTMASIMRLRVDADLTDNVAATVRLINERYWGEDVANLNTSGSTSNNNTNIDLDLAYVTLKEFLYSPLSLTVGRQELHFGNDMIIGDAYTNNHASKASVFNNTIDSDLSMRKSFDAVRATLDYNPLVIDVVAAQVRKNFRNQPTTTGITPVQSQSIDDQETLYGANATYTLNKKTNLQGYMWERRIGNNDKVTPSTKTDRTDVVGGRIITSPIESLTFQLEGAYQFGKTVNGVTSTLTSGANTATRSAWALETAATYNFKKVKYVPTLTGMYAYFSGNKDGHKSYGGWDPMYENQKFGDIANDLINQTNAHILGAVGTIKPMDDITLKGEYYAFWWDKKFSQGQLIETVATNELLTMNHKKFAAQEVDLTATYDYTEDVQFSLLGGMLVPGNSFSKANRNTAGELIGSMKVTF